MSRITPFVVAAAAFISISAFAQTAPSDANNAKTSPAMSNGATASTDGSTGPMKMHHRHHEKDMSATHTDHDADKLNACNANAVPTAKDESCLKGAEGAS